MPGIVREVSAIDVARMTLRRRDGSKTPVLLLLRKTSVQRQNIDVTEMSERLGGAADFSLSRKKDEHIAVGLLYRARHRAGNGHVAYVARLDRKHPPFGVNDFGVAEMTADLIGIQRRRHHHKSQIGPERAADFKSEGKTQIAGEGTLMEFVENDKTDVGQFGIRNKALGQKPFRQNLKTRGRRDFPLEPDLITDEPPDGRAEL